jgi:hypothetical protein
MQENRGKTAEQFLTPEKFLELQQLGFKNPIQTKYSWLYDPQNSSNRTLVDSEKTTPELKLNQKLCPAISFQELLQLLPKQLDITVPEELFSYYMSSDRIYPGIWRHDLEINFLKTGEIKVGYRWTYYDCSSPLYPFVKITDNVVMDEYFDSGIKGYDWVEAVYELLRIIIIDKYYHADISNRDSN